MDTFPTPYHREVTATISLKADAQDYEALRTHSKAAGLGQSNMLHLLMEMMRLRLDSERSRDNRAVDKFGSDLEAYVWLTAQDSGLVSAEDVQAQAWAVENTWGGAPFKDRLDGTFELLQKRFADRGGEVNLSEEFEPFEQVDDDHPQKMAAEIEAARVRWEAQQVNKADTDEDAGK